MRGKVSRALTRLLTVFLLVTGGSAQVWTYGDDRNDSPLYVAGDPPPPPKIGSIMDIEWYLDGLWTEEAWGILVFGFDFEMEANICYYSKDVDHLRNRWLLMPPLFPVGLMLWTPRSTDVFRYKLLIPADPILIGEVMTAQAFMQATDQHGGSRCDRFRATTALRIQFMR